MIFIALLILSATSLAGVAAYFSVWGLAQLFGGIFWSVVAMGIVIEAGKLVATSYMYRYWKTTFWPLKVYLILGILSAMLLTSTGIFGKLSAGYQADALPLKQIEEQVDLLNQEKTRSIDRKQQIDLQISQLPANVVRGRAQLMNGFKDEQKSVTKRVTELDSQILALKTQQITTEAHIGPITYIAKAFNLDTDNATKYLIYIIIFCFDPMAIALTLAANNALRIRKEEKQAENDKRDVTPAPQMQEHMHLGSDHFAKDNWQTLPEAQLIDHSAVENKEPAADQQELLSNISLEPEVEDHQEAELVELPIEQPVEKIITPELEISDTGQPMLSEEVYNQVINPPQQRRNRAYPHMLSNPGNDDQKMMELLDYYRPLKQKMESGEELTKDEKWEMQGIQNLLSKTSFSVYL